jgi:Ca-activated chloride channel family protein
MRRTLLALALTVPALHAQGVLLRIDPRTQQPAPCPLKHTSVSAEISGFLSRVTVTQEFENPTEEKIEAVYTFPLPRLAAVDDMTMRIGDRVVRGKIKRREEARAIYNAAVNAGYAAALLDQQRPNIFRQAVANIRPGEKVQITIQYVETLNYEDGVYEFVFPMVVAPRYRGGANNPPVTPKGTRAGHDISVDVTLDAGVPIQFLRSLTHDVDVTRPTPRSAKVHLRNKEEIPNRDFVLQYDVSGAKISDAVLAHRGDRGGFFTLILQPPDRTPVADITPKELVFVLDTSGSMMGFPIEKAKETMKLALEGLNPRDTFNLITFSGDTHVLFPQPVPATPENLRQAQQFLASRSGSGGTEMMKAIRAALDPSDSQEHIRVVCFMTDGHVGNDMQILDEVRKHPNARIFSFGIGSSTNRFLLDKMAEYGRGEVEYVGLQDDGSAAAKRFHQRVRSPLLTDISVEWAGLPVSEVYPKRVPDLFSAKPLILAGRYSDARKGAIRVRGKMAGRDFVREIPVTLPAAEEKHDVLATLWARRKIEDLMADRNDHREEITRTGLDYRLMTQYTSFVAVEETVVTEGGKPRRVEVPVEMPEGMSYEGVFGRGAEVDYAAQRMVKSAAAIGSGNYAAPMAVPAPPRALAVGPSVIRESRDRADQWRPESQRKVEASLLSRSVVKVKVRIFVTDTGKATLDRLKSLGVEVTSIPQAGRLVLATVETAKLQEVAKLAEVRYIAAEP